MKLQLRIRTAFTLIIFLSAAVLLVGSQLMAAEKRTTCPCCQITIPEAAAVLNISPNKLQKNSYKMMISPEDLRTKYAGHPCGCGIKQKNSFLKTISYHVYKYRNLKLASQEYNQMRSNFAAASEIDSVKGLGDRAFWAGAKHLHRLVALKGKVMIDVLNPTDFKIQKQVMHLILDKL